MQRKSAFINPSLEGVPMKFHSGLFLVCASLFCAAQVHATVLPDSCGDDKIQFNVTTQKDQPAPATPKVGDAQIVFVEYIDKSATGSCFGCNFTARVGVDGAWVGANKGNSYFTLAVAPGEHHLCAGWQSVIGKLRSKVDATSFTAEAGKTYYYQITIKGTPGEVTGTSNGTVSSSTNWALSLEPLNNDMGKYRVKVSALATATPKK
jgi:hypothetical protein